MLAPSMRWLVMCSLLALLFAAPDAAARRGARKANGPYSVAVAPFDGDKAGGRTLSEAIEFELELVETVLVKGDRWLRRDVRRAGERGWEPAGLRRIMKKRDLDVLIRGRRAGEGIDVFAFGRDGRPRFFERFPLPADPDESARDIVAALKPTLLEFSRAPLVDPDARGSGRTSPQQSSAPDPEVDEDDLFVDLDDSGPRSPVRDAPLETPAPGGDRRARTDADDWDSSADPVDEQPREQRTSRSRRLLGEEPSAQAPRRSLLGDDDAAERPRQTMADVEEQAGSQEAKPVPWLTLSAGAQGDPWYYEYAAERYAQDDLVLPLLTAGGVSARGSFWPIAYAGVEASAHLTYLPIDATSEPVRPNELEALHFGGSLLARARYPFTFGAFTVAPGVRAGYRHWSSSVEPQTHLDDDLGLTLVPAWSMHSLAVGADVLLTFVVSRWRFELEAQVEPLPLVLYEERPDNPGAIAKSFGGSGAVILRVPIYDPVFVALEGHGTAVLIDWECREDNTPSACYGTRLSPTRKDEEAKRERMEGGQSLNATFGGAAHIGISF